jgi:hypothetical protein
MDRFNSLEIPESLEDALRLSTLGFVVYDMQVGILRQIEGADRVLARVPACSPRLALGACGRSSSATTSCRPSWRVSSSSARRRSGRAKGTRRRPDR